EILVVAADTVQQVGVTVAVAAQGRRRRTEDQAARAVVLVPAEPGGTAAGGGEGGQHDLAGGGGVDRVGAAVGARFDRLRGPAVDAGAVAAGGVAVAEGAQAAGRRGRTGCLHGGAADAVLAVVLEGLVRVGSHLGVGGGLRGGEVG